MAKELLNLDIGSIGFGLFSEYPREAIRWPSAFKEFESQEEPEVNIDITYGTLPSIHLHQSNLIFDSEMLWSLYNQDNKKIIALSSPAGGPSPYRLAVFNPSFSSGSITSLCPEKNTSGDQVLPNPLDFPLFEVLMVSLLAGKRGLMIHGCGVKDGNKGYLFAGNSTHGKTTISRFWQEEATILNDDRIILTRDSNQFWMWGTPWHGDNPSVSADPVRLSQIFFLQHAPRNRVEQQSQASASTMLFTRSFAPLWDKEGMDFTLGYCDTLTRHIPCSTLGFVPNGEIIPFVRNISE